MLIIKCERTEDGTPHCNRVIKRCTECSKETERRNK